MKIQTKAQQRDAIEKAVKAQTTERMIYTLGYNDIADCAVEGKKEAVKSAFSTAVFKAGQFITLSKAGTVTSTKKPGNVSLLMAAAPALKHFYKVTKAHAVLINPDHVLNEKGQVWLHNRLTDNGPAFNTEASLVAPFVQMILKGTEVKPIAGFTSKAIKPVPKKYLEVKGTK